MALVDRYTTFFVQRAHVPMNLRSTRKLHDFNCTIMIVMLEVEVKFYETDIDISNEYGYM